MRSKTKKLGQHFLKNAAALEKIAAALDLKSGDVVVEIGPGQGELTMPLVKTCARIGCRIIAIEKDKQLIEILRNKVEMHRNKVEIIHGDALKILPKITKPHTLNPMPYKVVGNIPYYITGRLLRILSELPKPPTLTVLTLQKEVAERLTAKPPKMNLLSAIAQFWAEPEIIQILKPQDFSPPPKVDSAIIKLTPRSHPDPPVGGEGSQDSSSRLGGIQNDIAHYYKFVKILFKQPRKTIFNNLRSGLKMTEDELSKILKNHGLTGGERPQNLAFSMLIKLASYFREKTVL